MSEKKKKKKTKEEEEPLPLPPVGWTRCHAYMKRKGRFCRQQPTGDDKFCGNHQQYNNSSSNGNQPQKRHRIRVPCPIDPSHTIYQDQMEKHRLVCPKLKQQRELFQRPYYRKNINTGGHGPLLLNTTTTSKSHNKDGNNNNNDDDDDDDKDWAKRLALQVLQVHQRLLDSTKTTTTTTTTSVEEIKGLTQKQIHDALPMEDWSQSELDRGLAPAIESFRIKSGGERHLVQQASLLGHLRRLGVFDKNQDSVRLVEMGAGRGMLGLIAAGVLSCSMNQPSSSSSSASTTKTHLTLVERSGSRSKADTVLRTAQKAGSQHSQNNNNNDQKANGYMQLHNLSSWSRVQCDLAHVDMPTVLNTRQQTPTPTCTPIVPQPASSSSSSLGIKRKNPGESTTTTTTTTATTSSSKLVVVAKHLCGAGTDLALRSLRDSAVDTCVMATCCHGVCAWSEYVGRDFLLQEFGEDAMGPRQFDTLRKWSTGTVAVPSLSEDKAVVVADEHSSAVEDSSSFDSLSSVVQELGLGCGVQGLGRACQRILDAGRCHYMKQQLFPPGSTVRLCHYVAPSTTPQNAVLIGYKAS